MDIYILGAIFLVGIAGYTVAALAAGVIERGDGANTLVPTVAVLVAAGALLTIAAALATIANPIAVLTIAFIAILAPLAILRSVDQPDQEPLLTEAEAYVAALEAGIA